jgi:RNA polymerase sigma-70 factor (ECF subfamily)
VLAAEAFPRVTGVAQLILRDPELARDAVQETLIRAWRDLRSLRDPSRFDAWLHRTAVRTCLNVARRRRHRPIEVELSPLDAPGVPDHSTRIADREVVDAALRRLTPEGRAVIVLHFYLGLSLPETAAALGVPVGTAKSRLHRSLATMRVAISVDDGPGHAPLTGGHVA